MGVLATVGGVAVQAWLSRIVRAEEQGTVQGALTGIGAAAESVVPVPAGAVFAWSLFAWSLSHASPGLVLAGADSRAAGPGRNCTADGVGPSPPRRRVGPRRRMRRSAVWRFVPAPPSTQDAHIHSCICAPWKFHETDRIVKRFGPDGVDRGDSGRLPVTGNGQLLRLGTASAETG
ncbi:hypothetical protein [Micromonospora humidisoli]|uniref:hypothetical protein n=1 Tax=Micromonospora sp. AKA109 TaxID=2733865 RepID=UPI0024936B7B|nr:hypothetical protein [Micromonospora sp. AKA109]